METGPTSPNVQTREVTITPRGAFFIGASFAMTVAGLLRIDGVLISLGVAGVLLALIVLIVGKWNLRGIHLQLTAPRRVFADTPFDLRMTQFNRRRLFDACSTDLELRLSKSVKIDTHSSWVPAGSSSTSKLRGTVPARGAISRHPCLLKSTFPLGLFRFSRKMLVEHEILIFPKPIVPREFFATGEFDDAWNGEGYQAGDAPGEPRGLRPYQPGDRAKQIHWPSTIRSIARGRNPRVREYDPPGLRPTQAVVIYHSFGTDNTLIRTDLFERSLSLVCGTLRHLRGIGVPTNLRADFHSWKPLTTFNSESWSEALTLLARANRSENTEAHDVIAEIEATPPGHALVIISDMPPGSWQHILPKRRMLIVDIRQHRYQKKGLSFALQNQSPRSITS